MAETITYINPTALKIHPRNAEFFDDVDGAEFDRLVESIKDHGVLTPLRVTRDMTIISGHQRTRAAIQAGCTTVPVILDDSEDDNDVLMKLIETNFGRMKNDPIKQAKWIKEYEELRGVRQGSAGKAEPNNSAGVTQDDIAKELGVSRDTVQNLKKLLKLDPALQALISEGKINATTGFKILSKLTPEEQSKLVDKLPDDVKFSSETIKSYVEGIREKLTDNVSKAMEERDKLIGEKERLVRENNELRTGAIPVSAEVQTKIDKLEQESRDYYEKSQRYKDEVDRLRKEMDKAIRAKALAESKANGGDEAVVALENQIQELQQKLEAEERKSNDLEFQLDEKEEQIKDLKRESKEGFMRKALRLNETPEELSQRERDALVSDIQIAISDFKSKVEGALTQTSLFGNFGISRLKALVETCSDALSSGTRLKYALLAASGYEEDANTSDNRELDDYVYDDLDDSGLDFNLGA